VLLEGVMFPPLYLFLLSLFNTSLLAFQRSRACAIIRSPFQGYGLGGNWFLRLRPRLT
jgi:hypothetical protein